MDHYKSYGRRKAGTWGPPRKGNKTAAAQAVRTLQKQEAADALKDKDENNKDDK